MIALKKLDGSVMYLNEDLIERVEDGADGQSAVYMINGGHVVVANDSANVVDKIRTEKVALLRRVRQASQDHSTAVIATRPSVPEMTLLAQVRDQ
ncbi:MAG: flagellar FlbD family protein [Actinomycetota bacterium]|nr:flagellar FlbD family protein [Actinomycetota bacterium]